MANDHTRFHIDLAASDAALLVKLTAHLTTKTGVHYGRPDVMREALRKLAKKEKVA